MNERYPQNLKEAVIASVPNAMVMVLAMVALNLWIYDALTWGHFLHVVPIMFVVAFLFDFFIVGPIVVKFVRKYNVPRAMPFLRVAIMAGTLTFVAPLIESGTIITTSQYLMAAPRNYIAALLVQVFVALPFGLCVLGLARQKIMK